MGASFRAELLKLRKRPAIWVLGLLLLAFVLLVRYVIGYLSYLQAQAGAIMAQGSIEQMLSTKLPSAIVRIVINEFPLEAGAIALILGALVGGSEYGWGTLKMVLTQRPSRLAVYGGRVLALAVVLAVLVLSVFATAAGASFLIASIEGAAMAWPPAWEIVRSIGAAWLIVTMWASFGLLLATFFRGTALAIGLGLMWMLLIEGLLIDYGASLVGVIETIVKVMPGANTASLALAFIPGGVMPGQVSGIQATYVLIMYVMVFLSLAAVLVRTRDVT
jgi:ABC-type transport system involved in multi-copper enzyme maturation permease subunit